MIIREAIVNDINRIQIVRNSVKENILSNPALVTDAHCEEFITKRGKGWVCEISNEIVGFAIADIKGNNIWALFIKPEFEGKGIGRRLHNIMMDWYFSQTKVTVWLSTSPGTRAEKFYKKSRWIPSGVYGKDEVKFEMTFELWQQQKLK